MLTEPDMQARYVAAALGVIEVELRGPATATRRSALAVFAASTARLAARLANDLGQPAGRPCDDSPLRSPALAPDDAPCRAPGAAILPFRRSKLSHGI
jgi:hypothetical protein